MDRNWNNAKSFFGNSLMSNQMRNSAFKENSPLDDIAGLGQGSGGADATPEEIEAAKDDEKEAEELAAQAAKEAEELEKKAEGDEEGNTDENSDILEKYTEGKSFNEAGDLLNEAGDVIKTSAELDEEFGEEIILDANHNQVDSDGKIIKTKAELEAENFDFGDTEESSLIDQVRTASGYELLDEEGNAKVYENTVEGFSSYANDLSEKKANDRFEALISNNPRTLAYHNHLASGGTDQSFLQTRQDWASFDSTNATEVDKYNTVVRGLVEQGMSSTKATSIADVYKDKGIINEEFNDSLAYLKSNQTRIEKAEAENVNEMQAKQNKRVENYWQERTTIIKAGDLKGITIPESDREAFINYIAAATENGRSQNANDAEKEDAALSLQMDYLRFKKFDLTKMIATKVGSATVLNLKNQADKRKTVRRRGDGKQNGEGNHTNSNLNGVSLDNMMSS